MIGQAKALIKNSLIRHQEKKYYDTLQDKTVLYDTWIREKENRVKEHLREPERNHLTMKRVPYGSFSGFMTKRKFLKEEADICLFLMAEGREAAWAETLILDFFTENEGINLAYGDEDVMSPAGERDTPWLKPDWSPETFLSMFYFGSIFAVRSLALKHLTEEELDWIVKEPKKDERPSAYRLCRLLAEKDGGFAKRNPEGKFPIGHINEILFHSRYNMEMDIIKPDNISGAKKGKDNESVKRTVKQGSQEKKYTVSIIIPSKDQPDILKRCIESVQHTVRHTACEIIVLDNGSCGETKEYLADYLKRQGILYLYDKQPFNFSKMCNTGASAAKGDICLFLNDDTEAVKEGWLEQLCEQALKPYAGAVGCKLLYPESDRIQHAGIVNLRLGPVHKLQFLKDNESYYYNWNRGRRNVIAVTGACMAIEKVKFLEAGGFRENLPVAFNDVDLCFTLYEKGYYNAVVQDIFLYHHESLSRGQDEEPDKLKRLLLEKKKLYAQHKGFYGNDPFYHKYLAGDMLSSYFYTGADYEWAEKMPYAKPEKADKITKRAREDACVMASLEYSGTLEEWIQGTESFSFRERRYYLQGYVFVAGSDNACYEKKIILGKEIEGASGKGYKEIAALDPAVFRRKDVEINLPDQIHVGMTGFAVQFYGKDLEEGSYRIGVWVRDKCSGQRLFSWTNRYLEIRK